MLVIYKNCIFVCWPYIYQHCKITFLMWEILGIYFGFLISTFIPLENSYIYFFLVKATPAANWSVPGYGTNQSCDWGPTRKPQKDWIQAGSLTHWVRLGIKLTSSWRQCWVLNTLSHNGNGAKRYTFVSVFLCL